MGNLGRRCRLGRVDSQADAAIDAANDALGYLLKKPQPEYIVVTPAPLRSTRITLEIQAGCRLITTAVISSSVL